MPDDLAAHLVCLAGHGEALRTEPDGLVDALERVAARQAERALYPAAEHVLRAALRLHGAGGAAGGPAVQGRLTCAPGQVLDAAGREVWRWSKGRLFTSADQNRIVGSGETVSFGVKMKDDLPAGSYTAVATLTSSNHPVEVRKGFELR